MSKTPAPGSHWPRRIRKGAGPPPHAPGRLSGTKGLSRNNRPTCAKADELDRVQSIGLSILCRTIPALILLCRSRSWNTCDVLRDTNRLSRDMMGGVYSAIGSFSEIAARPTRCTISFSINECAFELCGGIDMKSCEVTRWAGIGPQNVGGTVGSHFHRFQGL